ncbi:MAG: GntR family transcriptional regulator [Planctomycetota bacterium]
MLHLQIDPHSGVPVYRQVMDQIKYYVASDVLAPGDRLPSIRELARQLHVNPTTIVKAYTELGHEGAIQLRQGKGAFVAEGARRMTAREREKALRRLARQLAVEAGQMGAAADAVLRVVREELNGMSKEEGHE